MSSGPRQTRVLIVEDEPRIAQFLAKGLRADGHDIVVAEDGDVGLFLATEEAFDIVILDLKLPGISGLEVLRAIRAQHAYLAVIVLTGKDDPAVRRACLAAGASGFMAKPLRFEKLRAAVSSLLSSQDGR